MEESEESLPSSLNLRSLGTIHVKVFHVGKPAKVDDPQAFNFAGCPEVQTIPENKVKAANVTHTAGYDSILIPREPADYFQVWVGQKR